MTPGPAPPSRRSSRSCSADVTKWLTTAKHPRWNRPYTEPVYQPMLELHTVPAQQRLQAYIVTGGGQDFVRVKRIFPFEQ
jgi:hypothetical protein